MAFNVNDKPKMPEQDAPEEGIYPARLVRIIEEGDQEDKYGVKSRVVFAFTVPSLTMELDGEKKQRMFMTFPLNKTSNPDSTVAKYVKALGGATWEDIIGKPCMIEISHRTKDGITRANITNVVKPMNGMEVAAPDCDVYIFDYDAPNKEVFDKLSEYRQDRIKNAVNYNGSKVQQMLEGTTPQQYAQDAVADSIMDDDIPF
tara:strand:- start:31472 stop:32077 length:606 start_codon:yes stop_codon:yes gene_type:complete